jgi:hypothetical protein
VFFSAMSIPGLLLLIIEVASQFFILFFATLIWLPRSIFQQENGFHFLVVLNTLWWSYWRKQWRQ